MQSSKLPPTFDSKPWRCDCIHALYRHSIRKEPNNGKRYYTACLIDGCNCEAGRNAAYPDSCIDYYK